MKCLNCEISINGEKFRGSHNGMEHDGNLEIDRNWENKPFICQDIS